MAKLISTNLMVLAVIGILLFSISANKHVVVGQCQDDMQALITQCAMYVQKSTPNVNPSQECCNVIKNADISCVCQHLTKAIMQFVDIQKVIYVAQTCGRPIPSGTNCGGVTVP